MTDELISVFLADDHAMVREGLAALLAKYSDIQVIGQCGDGLNVVQQVQEHRPAVVVLDISMPGLNGVDICDQLRRRMPETRVLILSMHDDEQFVARALEHGAQGYLLKESAAGKLAEAIRTVARGDRYLGPGIEPSVVNRLDSDDPFTSLTGRERQVLQLIAEGKTNREIGEQLGLAVKTVDTHRAHLMHKLDIHDQTRLVKYALRKGIIPLD